MTSMARSPGSCRDSRANWSRRTKAQQRNESATLHSHRQSYANEIPGRWIWMTFSALSYKVVESTAISKPCARVERTAWRSLGPRGYELRRLRAELRVGVLVGAAARGNKTSLII